jgi:uncharacterized protein (TIGR03067 family)
MFAALVTLTLAAPAALPDDKDKEKPLPEAAQKELKKIEAKWKAVKAVANGNEEADKEIYIEFKGRKLIVTDDGKEMEFFEVSALDPSTTPKLLDLKSLVDMGPIAKGMVFEAIYKLDGDDLTIAIYIGEGKKRPEKFESEKDSMVVVVTLKREKK